MGKKEGEGTIIDFLLNKKTYLPNAKCGLYLDSDLNKSSGKGYL